MRAYNKRWWRPPTPQKSRTTTADGVARIPRQSRLHHRTRCPRAPTGGAQCRQLRSSGPGNWWTTRPPHSQRGVYGGPGRCTPTHRAPVSQAPPTAGVTVRAPEVPHEAAGPRAADHTRSGLRTLFTPNSTEEPAEVSLMWILVLVLAVFYIKSEKFFKFIFFGCS